jgi:hypothetical protein
MVASNVLSVSVEMIYLPIQILNLAPKQVTKTYVVDETAGFLECKELTIVGICSTVILLSTGASVKRNSKKKSLADHSLTLSIRITLVDKVFVMLELPSILLPKLGAPSLSHATLSQHRFIIQ